MITAQEQVDIRFDACVCGADRLPDHPAEVAVSDGRKLDLPVPPRRTEEHGLQDGELHATTA